MNHTFVSLGVGLAAFSGAALAGDLNPPSAPAPTQAMVEPRIPIGPETTPGDADSMFRISESGSYYLTGNVSGETEKSGIEIAANSVTLDLMGFELRGAPGSTEGAGVTVDATAPPAWTGLSIRNGTVTQWAHEGFNLDFTNGSILEDLRAIGNGRTGISAGESSMVRNCTSLGNSGQGISVGSFSSVQHCTARQNGLEGFFFGTSSSASECVARENGSEGFFGGSGTVITRCASSGNEEAGFFTDSNCVIELCTARFNSRGGIEIPDSSSACHILNNNLDRNGPTFAGIRVGFGCHVVGNVATFHGVGIQVMGRDNVVDGNVCGFNDIGISVENSFNIIKRNQCHDSTAGNFDIGVNNYYGTIVNRVNAITAAAAGNAAPGTLGTTDPHANFAY